MEQRIRNPFVGIDEYRCFGCDPRSPIGLHLEFVKDGDTVTAVWEPRADLEGYPGVIHGGIQATLADEIGGWFVYAVLGTAGVTRELSVVYERPAQLADGPFTLTATGGRRDEKLAVIEVAIDNARGERLCSATCRYAIFSEAVARKRLRFPGRDAFVDG